MRGKNWELVSFDYCTPEDYYTLITHNKEHILATFPVTVRTCESPEKATFHFEKYLEMMHDGEGYYFLAQLQPAKKYIGYFVVKNIDEKINRCEFAYFIDKDHQGKGYTSQIVAAMVAFSFETLEMNKIIICTSKENIASQRVALKNGFTREGVLREEFKNYENQLEDVVYFGLLKSDYLKK